MKARYKGSLSSCANKMFFPGRVYDIDIIENCCNGYVTRSAGFDTVHYKDFTSSEYVTIKVNGLISDTIIPYSKKMFEKIWEPL